MITTKDPITNIKKLLSKTIIELPSFQRAYSWRQSEVKTFIDDVFLNLQKEEEYFIGVLYYIKGDKTKKIIDGQQRLTTIFLILNAIRLIDSKLFESHGLSFFIGNRAKLDFEESSPFCYTLFQAENMDAIRDEISKEPILNFSKMNLFINQEYIYNYLKDKNIELLIDNFLNNVTMIFIATDNLSSASKIFENINSKGLVLDNIDLIKNAYFSRIKDRPGEHDFSSVKYKRWKNIENYFYPKISNVTNSKELDQEKDQSLRNFNELFSIFVVLNDGKKTPKKSRKLYLNYLNKIDGYTDQQLREEMEKLEKLAASFTYIINPYDKSIKNWEFIQSYIGFMYQIGIRMHQPFIIALINVLENDNHTYRGNKKKMCSLLTKNLMFHFIFNTTFSLRPSIIGEFYNDISNKIYIKKLKFKDIENEFHKKMSDILNKNIGRDREKYKTSLKNILFTIDRCKADKSVLKKHTKKFKSRDAIDVLLGSLETYLRNDYSNIATIDTIEHISGLGGEKAKDVKNFNIFNLLPLEEKLNSDSGSLELSVKISNYRKSHYQLTKEFCNIYDQLEDKDEIFAKWQDFITDTIIKMLDEI